MPSLNIARFVDRLRHAPIPFPMRDWPHRLRLNVAAANLAPELYAAHVAAHGGLGRPWLALPIDIKQRYVDAAADALRDPRLR